MGQIHKQSEIRAFCPHIRGKSCRQRRRAYQRCFITVIIKHLKVHIHSFAFGILTQMNRGFQKLPIGLLFCFLLPFSCQEGYPFSPQISGLIDSFKQRFLRPFSSFFVDIIGV